jgi:hypothetical protein
MLTRIKHFVLTVELVEGEVMLILTYQREFIKNHWKRKRWELPIHAFYEIYRESTPLMLNLILYFLSMAAADGVFCDYLSIDELLDAVETIGTAVAADTELIGRRNKVICRIRFKKELHETPILRPHNELLIENASGKSRGADSFGKALVDLGYRSGYDRNITTRACRRWALMEAGEVSNTVD